MNENCLREKIEIGRRFEIYKKFECVD